MARIKVLIIWYAIHFRRSSSHIQEKQLFGSKRRKPRCIICTCIGGSLIFEAAGVRKLHLL
ncbi:hypothetical protein BDC45DRAFT_516307, partial [Circinella umbellata]